MTLCLFCQKKIRVTIPGRILAERSYDIENHNFLYHKKRINLESTELSRLILFPMSYQLIIEPNAP